MRVLVQRVSRGAVRVGRRETGRIGQGLLLLVGFGREDEGESGDNVRRMAEKIVHLRLFEDETGRMNRSVLEVGGGILAVPQFTLYADVSRGRRPSFTDAAAPEKAGAFFDEFTDQLRAQGVFTATGEFGAHMDVELVNQGPVTLLLRSEPTR